ncbi:hypothetical protein DDZ14_14010 [Maritimibacter sp. 55A14]|uniref:hypothetical protein n=1 Tax=Maritimibacter sp. 55A14 TaxID=2174844 RepID=UPI000D61855B|nr:hypothetical protein [Maritimibacter sp. 55A14]PWE31137.1 hypothetical protein DDZ14_14010 [Maritimibacter sp. 55A14]
MAQEWMIDVLEDLKSFAQKNGMLALAEQLDDTILVAAADVRLGSGPGGAGKVHADKTGALYRAHGSGDIA